MKHNYIINNEQLMKEWDWDKNNALGLFPDKLTCGVSTKVWWKCKECGYEWMTRVSHKNDGTGCKRCRDKRLTTASAEKSILCLYPNIAKEWDYNNNQVTPDMVYPLSNKNIGGNVKKVMNMRHLQAIGLVETKAAHFVLIKRY